MFNWFKKDKGYELTAHDVYMYAEGTRHMSTDLKNRLELLETHLGVEYFNGGKNKPHYRSKRVRKSN